jgi:copper transport protein
VSRRLLAALVGCIVALVALPGVALAHAELESTDPAAGAVLDESPSVVTLRFSETVEVSLGAIRLFDGAGTSVTIGTAHHPDGQDDAVQVELPSLDDGSYVVDWNVVSADSHPVQGAFTFQIGPQSDLQEGILDDIIGRDHTGRPAGIALAVSRGLVIAAIAIVFGGVAMVGFDVVAISSRLRRLLLGTAVVGSIAGLLQLPLEVGYASGRSLPVAFDGDAWSAAFDTRIGVAWVVRALVIGLLGTALVVTTARREQWWWRFALGVGLAGAGIASAFSGHGATGRWEEIGILATVVHVGAMALWLGGVVTVAVGFRSVTDTSIRRFSTIAFASMSAVVASGTVQSIRQVGSFDALTNTTYGTVLIWKLVLVLAVLGVAALSRRISRRDTLDRSRLRRAVGIELLVAAAIVVTTSLLMAANPSQAVTAKPFSTSLVQDQYLASITIQPGRVGGNEMHIYLSNVDSSLIQPESVTVQISDPSRDVAAINVPVSPSGAGHFTANAATFPYATNWKLVVTARYGDFDQVQFATTVPIR